uniref:CHCH domain-containing protein n=1 Tax=viral metagenome TaxID=1070528 RepID=A0A6C0DBP4_9ZZZZ
MPRQSSTAPVSSSRKAPVPFSSPVPAPAPSFGQTLKEGFAFGTGSAIAHRVVGAIFGPVFGSGSGSGSGSSSGSGSTPTPQATLTPQATQSYPTAYEQCLAEHRESDPLGYCAHLLKREALNQ